MLHGALIIAGDAGIGRAEVRLTHMHQQCILMHMRTTLIIDDALLERARSLTGIQEKTALVRAGLEALIAREAARRLAALGGTQPKIAAIPRRRSA
jgi:Arc/MetJ family transcription regulator